MEFVHFAVYYKFVMLCILMYGFCNKLVCLYDQVKVTDNNEKTLVYCYEIYTNGEFAMLQICIEWVL
jgi:hypothetical protein